MSDITEIRFMYGQKRDSHALPPRFKKALRCADLDLAVKCLDDILLEVQKMKRDLLLTRKGAADE